jgi:hypothetical protein
VCNPGASSPLSSPNLHREESDGSGLERGGRVSVDFLPWREGLIFVDLFDRIALYLFRLLG